MGVAVVLSVFTFALVVAAFAAEKELEKIAVSAIIAIDVTSVDLASADVAGALRINLIMN